jgi:benzoylformate decarboxylase
MFLERRWWSRQVSRRHTLTDPLLYGDLVSIATPAVKWAQEVTHPDQIPILVRRAFHDCQTAPTGPVFLSLPMDIMEQMTAVDIGEVSTIDRAAVAGSLDRLAEYLAAIPPGKLAIIAGDEISTSNAAGETVLLADRSGRTSLWFILARAHSVSYRASTLDGQSSDKGDRDISKTARL